MYGIGIFEIFLIFLVLLLFFEPKEIYSLFRRMGTWYRKIRKAEDDLKRDWHTGSSENGGVFGFDRSEESDEKGKTDDRKQ